MLDALLVEPSFGSHKRCWAGEHLAEMVARRRWAERRGLIAADAPQLPSAARLRGCLVECADLFRRHQRVGDVCGLDCRPFNALALPPSWARRARSLPLWQYTHRVLSRPATLAHAPLPVPSPPPSAASSMDAAAATRASLVRGAATLSSTCAGTCHALCVWVDFDFGPSARLVRTGPTTEADDAEGLAFGPTAWWQAVLFLEEPCQLEGAGARLEATVELDLLRGGALAGGAHARR